MTVPLNVQLIFGGTEPPNWNIDPLMLDEFKQRCVDLLTGAFVTEGERCVLFPLDDPTNPFLDGSAERKIDSVCGEVSIGIASVEVCWSPD